MVWAKVPAEAERIMFSQFPAKPSGLCAVQSKDGKMTVCAQLLLPDAQTANS